MEMPPGFPKTDDFDPSKITDYEARFEHRRAPGRGGKNYPGNYHVPSGSALVGYDYNVEASRHAGTPNVYVITEQQGILNVAIGVHIGNRLDTGNNPFGGSGVYAGTIYMKIVTLQDWLNVAIGGLS